MGLTLGYHGVHAQPIHALPELAGRVANLLTDSRWPWQPNLIRPLQFPGRPLYPWPKGKVPGSVLRDTVKDVLVSERATGIVLVASRKDSSNHAWVDIRSGHADYTGYPDGTACAFDARLLCRAENLPPRKSIDDWVELLHELTMALRIPHAVIWALPDERPIISLLYGVGSTRPDKPADHPHNESVRVSRSRKGLGQAWVRPPQWGTYLRPEHVTAVGGREKIIRVVQPALVRDVGDLTYFQLTANVRDSEGPEAEQRRRAFADLLEPVTVPRTQ